MEKLKYGEPKTYKHSLSKADMDYMVEKTNRSKFQTLFLFNLVDGDLQSLKNLEMQLRNCLCFYCPETKEEVQKVMKMKPVWNKLSFG